MDCFEELFTRIKALQSEYDELRRENETLPDVDRGAAENEESRELTKEYEKMAMEIQMLRSSVPEGESCFLIL